MCQVGLNPKPHCPNMWWRDLRELMPRRGGAMAALTHYLSCLAGFLRSGMVEGRHVF